MPDSPMMKSSKERQKVQGKLARLAMSLRPESHSGVYLRTVNFEHPHIHTGCGISLDPSRGRDTAYSISYIVCISLYTYNMTHYTWGYTYITLPPTTPHFPGTAQRRQEPAQSNSTGEHQSMAAQLYPLQMLPVVL